MSLRCRIRSERGVAVMKGECKCDADRGGSLVWHPGHTRVAPGLLASQHCVRSGSLQPQLWLLAKLAGERCYLECSICISLTKQSSVLLTSLRALGRGWQVQF